MRVSGFRFYDFGNRGSISNFPITLFTLFALLTSCGTDVQTKQFAEKQSKLSDNLVEANKSFVKNEAKEIDDFIKQHGYEMEKTETGLRYNIVSESKGDKAEPGDLVTLKYQMQLLNGTVCYSSDSTGLMSFKVDQEDVPNGFHQAVQLMRKGDKAQIVMPAHLAYGLTGDQKKIPGESALYCTLQMVDLKKKLK